MSRPSPACSWPHHPPRRRGQEPSTTALPGGFAAPSDHKLAIAVLDTPSSRKCRISTRGDRRARFEQTAERHAGLSQFAAPFLSRMKFVDEQGGGTSPTLAALRVYREHRAAGRRGVPPDAPLDFAPPALQPLIRRDGVTDRRRWESALFLKVRDGIQTGNLAIDGAKNFGRFEAFFLPAVQWEQVRDAFWTRTGFPVDPGAAVERLKERLSDAFDASWRVSLTTGRSRSTTTGGGSRRTRPSSPTRRNRTASPSCTAGAAAGIARPAPGHDLDKAGPYEGGNVALAGAHGTLSAGRDSLMRVRPGAIRGVGAAGQVAVDASGGLEPGLPFSVRLSPIRSCSVRPDSDGTHWAVQGRSSAPGFGRRRAVGARPIPEV